MRQQQGLVPDPGFFRIWNSCLVTIVGNVSPIHDVQYLQIWLICRINYLHKFQLNTKHFKLTPISNPLFDIARVAAILLFFPLRLFIQACAIYQKKAFWELCNFGLTFTYWKMDFKGRKLRKTHILRRPSWIWGCHVVSPHFCEGHGG